MTDPAVEEARAARPTGPASAAIRSASTTRAASCSRACRRSRSTSARGRCRAAASTSASTRMPRSIRELEEETGLDRGDRGRRRDLLPRLPATRATPAAATSTSSGSSTGSGSIGGELRDEIDGTTDTCGLAQPRTNSERLRLVELARFGVKLAFPGRGAVKSTLSIDVAAPAEPRVPPRPRRRALAAAAAPLRRGVGRSSATATDG